MKHRIDKFLAKEKSGEKISEKEIIELANVISSLPSTEAIEDVLSYAIDHSDDVTLFTDVINSSEKLKTISKELLVKLKSDHVHREPTKKELKQERHAMKHAKK